ncbi:MAG: DUF2279 domain-containing protein [Rubricoccaceae bacterium]|nr:DUF2279 domain-containing protein [Rubricoccaceae bacterium]
MRLHLLLLLALPLALLPAPRAQDAALGYRMAGLDLAVFDGDAAPDVAAPDADLLGADSLAIEAAPVSAWRVAALAGATVGSAVVVLEAQRRRWWQDRSPRFRVANDWAYVRWADKVGHVYSSAIQTRIYRSTLRWAGVPEPEARLWGAVGGFANMLFYEILDGFGPQWGFSPGDAVANTLGVVLATAQADDPAFDAFFLKMSYWPSGWEGKNLTDDYAGQTFWLTANPHRLAPEAAKPFLPPWLNVAAGYGARDRDALDFLTTSVVYLGVDLEPAGLPFRGKVWDALVPILRHVHVPGPAVRLTPDPAFVPFAF